jgi:hypothetical protein
MPFFVRVLISLFFDMAIWLMILNLVVLKNMRVRDFKMVFMQH